MGTEKIQGVVHEPAVSSLNALAPPFQEGNLTFVKDHAKYRGLEEQGKEEQREQMAEIFVN